MFFFPPIIRSTLATETGANNPGLRLYKYDTEAGEVNGQWPVALCVVTIIWPMLQIVDYDQYYLNLTDVISGGPEQWQKSYSMLDYYGLQSLSVSNLSDHVYRVKKKLGLEWG